MKYKIIEIYGSKNKEKLELEDFGINQNTIDKLYELINLHEDLELIKSHELIEVICVEKNQIRNEMISNNRIQSDSNLFQKLNFENKCGLRVPPWLLKKKYKEDNICYCVFKNLLDIPTIFHELAHFYNQPFDNEPDKKENLDEYEYLRFQVRKLLNEYCANYNVFKFFSYDDSWYESLKNNSFNDLTEIVKYAIPNKNSLSNEPIMHVMKFFLENIFNRIFYFMGIWRGFYENMIDSNNFPFSLHWEFTLTKMEFDKIDIKFLDFLKQDLLNKRFESAETFGNHFEDKFREYFDSFNLSK